MIEKCRIAAALVVLICSLSSAQSMLAAHYPAGLQLAVSTGPSLGIGGAGAGVKKDFFGIADNVANLGSVDRAVFSAVVSSDFLRITENNTYADMVELSPRLFSFAFPIARVGSFGFSLDRRSSSKLKFMNTSSFSLSDGTNITDSLGVALNGGITAWQAGWGLSVGRFGSVGISFERIFLFRSEIDKLSTSIGGGTQRFDSTEILSGSNALRMGVLFPAGSLTLGITGEYVFESEATRRTGSTEGTILAPQKFMLHLPPSVSAGASYSFSPGISAAGSVSLTIWELYHSGVQLGSAVDNAVSVSAGAQFIPAPNMLVPKYWEVMQYRAGVRYSQLPVATASELAFTAGIGLPLQQGDGLFDLTVELGRRTDSKYAGFSEDFMRIMIGINGARKWYKSTGTRY